MLRRGRGNREWPEFALKLGGVEVALAAANALHEAQSAVCYDLVLASLGEAAQQALEDAMRIGQDESNSEAQEDAVRIEDEKLRSEMARMWLRAKGRAEGRAAVVLALAERHGPISSSARDQLRACRDPAGQCALALELAGAADVAAVERVIATLDEPNS